MLTKRFQKLLFGVFVLVVTVLVFGLYSQNPQYVQDVHKAITSQNFDMDVDFEFYQQLMKNYTSGFYTDVVEGWGSSSASSLSLLGSAGQVDPASLVKPAFDQDSLSPADALQRNQKYIAGVLSKKVSEPKNMELTKIADLQDPSIYKLENATFVSLVRNSELRSIVSTIQQIEATFNKKYHYPYVFLNDKPFSERFKKEVEKVTESTCFFEQVDAKDWDKPDNIDPEKEKAGVQYLVDKGVGYSKKVSYHNMCRYYSGRFYQHPRMKQFKYYWRLEPSTNYFCDIDYDVFKFMNQNNKVYGFVLNLYDSPDSVRSLWPTTIEFLNKNPQYIHPNAAMTWLRENLQNPQNYAIANGYSTCHFWSNFEIGDMDFYRGEAYSKWMDYLEESGGFYYERWGDAPVHSVGLGLFADKTQIHWFRDIGYEHFPYFNCPVSDKCGGKCKAGHFSKFNNLNNQNCQATWSMYEMTPEQLEQY